ncbi:ribonuclease HII [Gudongella sp. SC589]|uniref:ribonuclease HII n=1 Tax=Gudongella sp. SC589 TaxID=3385990 RepID=UPI00390476A8
MFEIEQKLFFEGHKLVACIDEVGRGCLYGDVVAGAVILPAGFTIDGVKDSKKLSEKKRENLFEIIKSESVAYGFGVVGPEVIDKINIRQATRLAMKLALNNLRDRDGNRITPSYVLVDAEDVDTNIPQKAVIDGDNLVHGISAASILAKVYRDRMCQEWDMVHPGYDLAKNKGYGTKNHRDALVELGPTNRHRMTFLKNILRG